MTYVQLGNDAAIEGYRDADGKMRHRSLEGQHVTSLSLPPGLSMGEMFKTVTKAMRAHYQPGAVPVWVESDDGKLAQMIEDEFSIEHTRPEGWGRDTGADLLAPPGVGNTLIAHAFMLSAIAMWSWQLRTDAGRDLIARVLGDPSSSGTGQYAPATWIGLTSDATPPDAGNTTLVDEVTDSDLSRAQGSFAHTNGSPNYTLTKLFTADEDITISKVGIFNDDEAGTMAFETLLEDVAVLQTGDELNITETVEQP